MNILLIKTILKFISLLLIPILLIQGFAAGGQTKSPFYRKVDTLLYQLNKSRPDSNRVMLLTELSNTYLLKEELRPAEFQELFKHLKNAVALCDSLGPAYTKWKINSLYLTGNALILCDSVAEGKSVFMNIVANAHNTGDKKREAQSWVKYAEALLKANKAGTADNDREVAYTNAANIYSEIKDKKGEIDMCIELGRLHGFASELNKADSDFLAVVKKSEAFGSYNLCYAYYLLSITNRYMGNYNKALGYVFNAIKAMEDTKDSSGAGDYYGELAELYQALDKPVESALWYKKCIYKRELIPGYPPYALYRTYSLLVGQLIKAGAIKEALATTKNLQKNRPPNTLAESAVLYQSMAYCYDAYNAYDSTEKYFLKTIDAYNQSYKILHMTDEIMSLARFDMADFYIRHHQFLKARHYLDTLMAAPVLSILKLADAQLLLFKADSAAGQYIAAIKHLQQYKILADSIFTDKKSRDIEQLQIEYKTRQKDEEIGLLTKKDQLQQANLRQATIIRNWIMASAALLILLLGVGYNRYRFKQKTNKQLEEQQIVINQKNISLQHLVNEKEWLVKEIHHRVKNNFHIVIGLLGTQSGYLKNKEAIAAMKESQQRIHAMSLIHQKLYQSESLSAIDMPGYIHELVDYLKDSFNNGASIQFHFQLHRITLGLSHVMPIGLILNEAVNNVIKYAFPNNGRGNIYISFTHSSEENKIVLTVKDDGIGLPAGFNSNRQSSMGINLMKGLSEDIDGSFTIQSNNGTTVTVTFNYSPDMIKGFAPTITDQNFIA